MSVQTIFGMAGVLRASNEHRNHTVPTDRDALEIAAAVQEVIRRCNAVDYARTRPYGVCSHRNALRAGRL
jgi:hypothetical protein